MAPEHVNDLSFAKHKDDDFNHNVAQHTRSIRFKLDLCCSGVNLKIFLFRRSFTINKNVSLDFFDRCCGNKKMFTALMM